MLIGLSIFYKKQRPHESVKISEKEDLSIDFRAFFDGVMSDWFFQRKNLIESVFTVVFETILKRSRFKIVFELWPKIHIPAVQKKMK